jgi:hypothetical protein
MAGTVRISVDEFGGGIDSCTDIHEDVHVRACVDDGTDTAARERADVLYFDRAVSADEVAAQLDAYPGCVVCVGASADGAIALAVRAGGGGPGRIAGTAPLGDSAEDGGEPGRIAGRLVGISGLSGGADGLGLAGADCALIASFVHALLTRGVRRGAAPRTGLRVPFRERLPDWHGR